MSKSKHHHSARLGSKSSISSTNGAILAFLAVIVGVALLAFISNSFAGTNTWNPYGSVVAVRTTCTDSDFGANTYIKGKTTLIYSNGSIETNTDSCVGASTVREWFCVDGSASADSTALNVYLDLDCLSGERCLNGACVKASG